MPAVLPRQAVRGLETGRPRRTDSHAVRPIRDDIDHRVRALLSDLLPKACQPSRTGAPPAHTGRVADLDELSAQPTVSDRRAVHWEMRRARDRLHTLVASASAADLRRRTDGTGWTNRQMLFHMVFGYLIVLRLLPLVRFFGRIPDRYSRAFSGVLNAATRPFHTVNYVGSCGGALVFHGLRLVWLCDRVIAALDRRLDHETEHALNRTMHFPVGWDPYFRDTMTLLDVYRFGTEHFDYHARQLTLGQPARAVARDDG